MEDAALHVSDIIRWVTIGQSLLSGTLALTLGAAALRYYYRGHAWRRFTFILTFTPSYVAMFAYIAFDLRSRTGMALGWRTWTGVAVFTIADYAMFVLLGHLLVKREKIHDDIKHYTIIHDPHIEYDRHRKESKPLN